MERWHRCATMGEFIPQDCDSKLSRYALKRSWFMIWWAIRKNCEYNCIPIYILLNYEIVGKLTVAPWLPILWGIFVGNMDAPNAPFIAPCVHHWIVKPRPWRPKVNPIRVKSEFVESFCSSGDGHHVRPPGDPDNQNLFETPMKSPSLKLSFTVLVDYPLVKLT